MDRLLSFLINIIVFLSRLARPLSRLFPGIYDEWTPGKKRKILLAGYNGARNTGSDVRVIAIARQLRDLFGPEEIQITVMTMDPATMEGYFDEDVVLLKFSSLFPFDLMRACWTHHAVILCEGSTLKSTFANALTLFQCEAAGIMAAQNKPCLAYGAEIGKMEPFLEKAAVKLCRKTYFITRTEGSQEALQRLGLRGHAGTDAAWYYDGALGAAEADSLLMAQGWDGKKPLLGVAVIDPFCWPVRASFSKWIRSLVTGNKTNQYDKWYFFSDSPDRRRAFRRYLKEVAAGVNAFLEAHDYYPVVIGMERLDAEACRALRAQLRSPGAMFLSGDHSAAEMTGILHRLSALVTSRYHASVLTMDAGCSIVAVSMDERLDGIMKELSWDRDYTFHVADEALGKKITAALEESFADREVIRQQSRERTEAGRVEIGRMGEFMKEFLKRG